MEADLPLEILLHIFSFVHSPRDILSCGSVSHDWRSIAEDDYIWKGVFANKWKFKFPARGWKDEFMSTSRVPSNIYQVLEDHSDEVWTVKWSHNGKYLASASKDRCCHIYELKYPECGGAPYLELYHTFTFVSAIAFSEWSYSDNYLAVTSLTCQAFVLNVKGKYIMTSFPCVQFDANAVWLPDDSLVLGSSLLFSQQDSRTFVQHSLWRKYPISKDKHSFRTHTLMGNCIHIPTYVPKSNALIFLSASHPLNSNILNLIFITRVPGGNVVSVKNDPILKNRSATQDIVLAETGAILGVVVSSCGRYLLVNIRPFIEPPKCLVPKYNVHTIEHNDLPSNLEADHIAHDASPGMEDRREGLTERCLNIQQMFEAELDNEAKAKLSNHQAMHVWDLYEMKKIQSYTGHTADSQSDNPFMSWPTIGKKYLATGSEDGNVYVFHKEHNNPIHVLSGHKSIVNAVDSHPTENLLASVSDDHTIHLWGPPLYF